MNLKDVPVIDLDLYYRESNQPDYLKTDDANGRYRKYRLAYGGTPMDLTGVTARCYMMKADGKSVYIDAEIEGNVVTVCFTNQALACPGVLKVEIVLYGSDNSEISSFIMEYVVIKSLRNPDTLESTNEFSALVSTINTVNDLQAKEQLIQAREAVRIANEDTRIATEATRERDEETRKNNESTRQSNETTRIASENTREGKEFTRQQDETTRKANEVTRQSNETGRVNAESTRVAEFNDIKNQWNSLSPDQASNVEVQQARRDVRGVVHDSLSKRLESDSKMRDTLEETKEGTYLTFDGSVPSPITNVIVKGNTYQNPNNLVEIVSSGIDNGDGTWTYEVVACGENLWNIESVEHGKTYYAKLPMGQFTFSLVASSTTSARVGIFVVNEDNSALSSKVITNNVSTSITFTNSKVQNVGFKIGGWDSGATLQSAKDIKLQEGTVATPYTPYEENRCTIKLPCQLEKWDSLYYDKVENAWCVNKVMTVKLLKSNVHQGYDIVKNGFRRWYTPFSKDFTDIVLNKTEPNGFCDKLPVITDADSNNPTREGLVLNGGSDGWRFMIVTVESIDTVTKLNDYLSRNPLTIKYPSTNNQKIVLPQSEQIKLNALANQTNVYVNSGALDAIISATVAKSHTSATLANTDKIIDVENRLQRVIDNKDDVEYTYKSTNGYVIAKDTNRGNISKATINGKSVANALPKAEVLAFSSGGTDDRLKADSNGICTGVLASSNYYVCDNDGMAKCLAPLTTYTNKGYANITVSADAQLVTFRIDVVDGVNKTQVIKYNKITKGSNTVEFNDVFDTSDKASGVCGFYVAPSGVTTSLDFMFMMLEGDQANTPVGAYVNGIGSVYNPNGLELKTIEKSLDYVTELVTAQKRKNFRLKEPIQPNSVLTNVSNKPIVALLFDIANPDAWTQDITMAPGESYTIPTNRIAKIITIYPHNGWRIESEIYLEELIDIDGYPRRDANKVFYKDNDGEYQVLTEIQEFDTLDLTNGTFTKGTLTVKPDSDKYWRANSNPTSTHKTFWRKYDGKVLSSAVCDKLPVYTGTTFDKKCIFVQNTEYLYINLPISECSDISQLATWFKNNNIEILLPIEQAKYKTNALSLDVFDGDTLVTTNATNVKPGFDVTITSSINSLIGNIDDTLDNAVDDIQAIKHDVAKITSSKAYEFNGVGSKVMNDTEQGTLSELKIYGNSLVNRAKIKTTSFQGRITSLYYDKSPLNGFTIIFNTTKNTTLKGIHLSVTDALGVVKYIKLQDGGVTGRYVGYVDIKATDISVYQQTDDYGSDKAIIDDIVLVEGDRTQNPPQYFEGVASVGTKGGIGVRSNNGNLFNENLLRHRLEDDGYYHFRGSGNTRASLFMGIVDKSYKQITSMTSNQANDLTNLDLTDCKVLIGMNGDVKDDKELMPITEFGLGNFPIYKGCEYEIIDPNHIRVKSVYIKHGIEPGNYVPYESDTKPILYKDVDSTWKPVLTLHGVDENRRDIVDTSTNSYTSMMMKVVEVGGGGWQVADGSKANTLMFFRMFNDNEKCELSQNNSKLSCDKFNSKYVYSLDEEGIFINRNSEASNGGVYIRINRSSLSTPDVPGFTKWLQSNNVSYLYKRGDIRTYEINPILTQVFDNSTLIQILGGAISADFTAKCIASYSRRIESIESRLDRVEESVFKAVDVVSAMAMATDLRSIDLSNNVEQTQRAQDTMLMESDMRLMSMELLVNSTKPVSTDIKYVMYDAKGGATIMSASYYNFIAMCIANKTQSPEYLENYMNLCLQTGRLDQDEFDKLHAMLYPTTTEQPTK